MANRDVVQNNDGSALASVPRELKTWVLGLLGSTALMVVLGLWLGTSVPGTLQLWSGATFVVAMGLALVVGASKTPSA